MPDLLFISSSNLPELRHWHPRTGKQPPEPASVEYTERSRQLVLAAYQLLSTEGLDGLTVRAVLKSTGLARRAFYERFAGKDDLVLAVFEYILLLAAEHFRIELIDEQDPIVGLKRVVMSLVLGEDNLDDDERIRSDRRTSAMSREHLRLAESRPDELRIALKPLLSVITKLLTDGITKGVVREADPERLALLLYNLVSHTVHSDRSQPVAAPDYQLRQQQAEDLWEFCFRAIKK